MLNDYLNFKIHEVRHAELIRQGAAQRLAESLVPRRQTTWQIAAADLSERLEAWWENIKRQIKDAFIREQPSVSDPC